MIQSLREKLDQEEKREIERTLKQVGGNVAEAARRLGMTRQSIYRAIERLHIHLDSARY